MLGYVTLGANDFERAKAFYRAALAPLGARPAMSGDRMELYTNGTGAMLGVCIPYDKGEATPGNGVMPAISAPSREVVDQVHAAALANGGTCEGPPGERMPTFYGAYFRDTEGNKICVYKMG
ncbi:VOC family protein [Phenylobacterium sp.]|uniref:VOC family protein n=1 Tax=Phenylobacterium sp. TaxID=1871053 RepID=UPI0025FCA1C2|nr:VOC family protein [Phenylobacterium sp.]MCA6224065.1 VOC family protein [Phenylobacterium sp.]MCA6318177.1 VOC family protein [Phenylobacterium sp.]MCA6327064.1 VOC family protein [Phenylobacterium sp.]